MFPKKMITPYQELFISGSAGNINLSHFDYLVLTPQKYTFASGGRYLTKQLDNTLSIIEKTCQPIKTISQPLPQTLLYVFAFDHNADLKKNLDFIKNFDYSKDSQIRIYKLSDCSSI